ncbi:MAG: flavoprotein [Burkholderiales bacterium RIFCSPLOWO2_02_FULL_57_36]|nr:MAG: flavoprotein [Burkholderiales bacterium RIFCSPLOWO2_02_FULL_57_36]
MNIQHNALPVAVLGAGPVGMAAAAHLIQRGFTPLILESGDTVGANLESFRHVKLFSPWRYNIDAAARSLLEAAAWQAPDPEHLPTAGEFIEHYLQPLADLPRIAACLKLRHRVNRISRQGQDKIKTAGRDSLPFLIRVHTPAGEQEFAAQAILDASGTWSQPNPLGASGIPAIGESSLQSSIAYGMPDILGAARSRYAGKRTLVVGAGHSAAANLIALAQLADEEPGTTLVWAIRGKELGKLLGGGEADGLPERGRLGIRLRELRNAGRLTLVTNFRVRELRRQNDQIEVLGEPQDGIAPSIERIDRIIAATGSRPELQIARELRTRVDPWIESTEALALLIDPNLHSCGTVQPHGHRELAHPESGYYAVGAKSYGRAPNFLMATGYVQVRSVVAALAHDMAAADDVRLALPGTGVCSTDYLGESAAGQGSGGCCGGPAAVKDPAVHEPVAETGCCGGAAPVGSSACCVLDAEQKAKGNAGCGCNTTNAEAAKAAACCG